MEKIQVHSQKRERARENGRSFCIPSNEHGSRHISQSEQHYNTPKEERSYSTELPAASKTQPGEHVGEKRTTVSRNQARKMATGSRSSSEVLSRATGTGIQITQTKAKTSERKRLPLLRSLSTRMQDPDAYVASAAPINWTAQRHRDHEAQSHGGAPSVPGQTQPRFPERENHPLREQGGEGHNPGLRGSRTPAMRPNALRATRF